MISRSELLAIILHIDNATIKGSLGVILLALTNELELIGTGFKVLGWIGGLALVVFSLIEKYYKVKKAKNDFKESEAWKNKT